MTQLLEFKNLTELMAKLVIKTLPGIGGERDPGESNAVCWLLTVPGLNSAGMDQQQADLTGNFLFQCSKRPEFLIRKELISARIVKIISIVYRRSFS